MYTNKYKKEEKMRAIVVIDYDSGGWQVERIEDVSGWNLEAYAEQKLRRRYGRCGIYIVCGGGLALAAVCENHRFGGGIGGKNCDRLRS